MAGAQVVLVDSNATTGGNAGGPNWADAYTSLDTAIALAPTGAQILVAEGRYYPTTAAGASTSNTRELSFALTNGHQIQGGFLGLAGGPGASTAFDAPDGSAAATLLVGDVGVPMDPSDNSYSVCTVVSLVSDDVQSIENLTIIAGYANATPDEVFGVGDDSTDGAGIYHVEGNLEVGAVRFLHNYASESGAGIYSNTQGEGYFGIKTSHFELNSAGRRGGAAYLARPGTYDESTNAPEAAWLHSCTFVSNTAGETGSTLDEQGGGAVWFGLRGTNSTPAEPPIQLAIEVANNRVLRNTVRGRGAAYFIDGTNELPVRICNDTIADNTVIETAEVSNQGGILFYAGGQAGPTDPPPVIDNTIIYGNDDVINFRSIEGPGVPRLEISYSNVERVDTSPLGGGSGGLPAVWPGDGNINENPLFNNLIGLDVTLGSSSPCIDTGLDSLLQDDHGDLDMDDVDDEPVPLSVLLTETRVVDQTVGGTCGQNVTVCGDVDMGAHERQ